MILSPPPRLRVELVCALLLSAPAFAQEKNEPAPPAKGTISGTVTAVGSNAPMKDVEVWINRNGPKPGHAVTDGLGRYMIRDVTPGPATISANAPIGGRVGFGPSSQRSIQLAPGQELGNVDFHLQVFGMIAGRVTDQNKEPVVGISVYLVVRDYSHGALRSYFTGGAQTDDEGKYELTRVQPGRAYAVLAQKRYRSLPPLSESPLDPALRLPAFVPTYHPNADSINGADWITVRPGELREGVDVRVLRAASFCVDALVEGAAGPVRFSIAETVPHSGASGTGGFYTALPGGLTGGDGKIRACDLHAGEYELTISQSPPAPSGGFFATSHFASTIVTIGDHDVSGIHLALRGKIPVAGEIVFDGPPPDPPPTSKLTILVEAITRTERGDVRTDMPSEFSFDGGLLSDDYGLDVRGIPPAFYLKDVSYGGHSILYQPIPVGRAQGDGGLRIVLARDGGRITARVTDKDGNPVPDCGVAVLPADAASEAVLAASMKTGRTDQSGTWTSTAVPPGKYSVVATLDPINRSPECIGKLWKARLAAAEVSLAPQGKSSLRLSPSPLN
jgi:hypothetical protein